MRLLLTIAALLVSAPAYSQGIPAEAERLNRFASDVYLECLAAETQRSCQMERRFADDCKRSQCPCRFAAVDICASRIRASMPQLLKVLRAASEIPTFR
jgi:uncharacterized SAM-dependent methyltransferase